jgi:multisubunit Na+/H+ antiporter MnhB subunit
MDRPSWLRAPHPRVLDGSLLVGVAFVLATGIVSLFSGRPTRAWVFLTTASAAWCLPASSA